MTNSIQITGESNLSLLKYICSRSALSVKTERSRLSQFENWLANSKYTLFTVDLGIYSEYLLRDRGLAASTVNAHLKTIRGRYRAMMKTNEYRDALTYYAQEYAQKNQILLNNISDLLAVVNEVNQRIENHIFAAGNFVRETKKQDRLDDEYGIRLNELQVKSLMKQLTIETAKGLRDAAIIALAICTGLREFEISNLRVEDLRQTYDGHLALRVRDGKGAKQRAVVYGEMDWCLVYVNAWLKRMKIEDGFVFRGFWGKSKKIRTTGISVRQLNNIVGKYPVLIAGEVVKLTPHDLRRTYARLQYENGMSPEALQQNMGHETYQTTLGYIGNLDGDARAGKASIELPHDLDALL